MFSYSFLIWSDTAVSVERIIELKSFQVGIVYPNNCNLGNLFQIPVHKRSFSPVPWEEFDS